MQRRSSRNRPEQETAAMKNENDEEITQEELDGKIEDICRELAEYFVYVTTHVKFDENNKPFADPELQEYMKKGQEQAISRAKYFKNKELAQRIQQFIEDDLNHTKDFAFEHAEIIRKSRESITEEEQIIKTEQWLTTYMPAFSNTIASFKEKNANIKEFEDIAELKTPHGTLKIIDYSKLKGKKLNTPAKKILDMCILKVSQTLVYGATDPNNRYVSFTVEELAQLMDQSLETARQREKFIERVYESAKQLKYIRWTQSNGSKKIKDLKYDDIALFEYSGKDKNVFKFMFTQSAAFLLAHSPVCESFPTNLFKLDNRYGGNAYEIGRKMIRHTDIYVNRKKGNNCTLSVVKLIENSEIPTFEDIESKNRRDWKEKIKKPLEKALNDLLEIGFLSRWEYRTPTEKRLTQKQADKLNAKEYQSLVVDFSIFYSEEEQAKRFETDTKLIEKSNESNG